jgi:1-acyl-sn-glycerol-3-phosphate acyltransferase
MRKIQLFLRITVKAILFSLLVLGYILVSLFWRVWTRDLVRRRRHFVHTVSFFTGMALKLLNIKVRVIHPPDRKKSYLLVGNHLGFLDIFVLSSSYPCLFVTSVDMRSTPGLGFLTEMGGCLYVERRNRSQLTQDIEKIREALKQHFSVALYPEGGASNGEKVLPFKKSLIAAAAGTGIPILPVVINYRKVNGEPMSHKWRDHVFWYGDQTFLPAVQRIFSMESAEVDLEFCEEVNVSSKDHRRDVTEKVEESIVTRFAKVPAPEDATTS